MTDPQSPPPRRNPHLVRAAIVSVLGVIGIVGFVVAFALPGPEGNPQLPVAVELVSPEGGDLDLRQVSIMADLAPGYTGYLTMDGVEVPEDDLYRVDPLNQVFLRPTEDSDYLELAPGRHCAGIVYRQIGAPRAQSNNYTWCFNLH